MKKAMFKKAANSFAGRMLRRLMGEEKGSVMIEYILVALLIVVVGVVIFSALAGKLGSAGEATMMAMDGVDDAAITDKINSFKNETDKANTKVQGRLDALRGSAWGSQN